MKKHSLTFGILALICAGCSENRIYDVNPQDRDAIKFSSTTSRASIADLGTLQGAATGFAVYATSGAAPSAWYAGVDGTSNYYYNGNVWGWVAGNPQWPLTAAGYPMDFYAYYPSATASVAYTATTSPGFAITGAVTIANTAADQVDLLAATAQAAAKPFSGVLSLTFGHILSKIDIGVLAGTNMNIYVQSAYINNVVYRNTYDYMTGTWGTANAAITRYEYFKNTDTNFKPANVTDETIPNPIYPGTHSNHLMLMPQSATAWNNTEAGLATGAFIEVVYRLDNASGQIGYTDATDYLDDYPAYVDGTDRWSAYTGISAGATPYGSEPLYIRVGFPVAVNWTKGKGYTYNLCLGTAGSSNGYYVDDTYYDKDGIDTGIPIIGPGVSPVAPGDPVADGTIHFKVAVDNWDEQTAAPLQ